MSARYFFLDFSRFEHLENFLRHQIQEVADRFIPDGRYDLVTRTHTMRSKNDSKGQKFVCEVKLDAPQSSVPIVIKKTSTSFQLAALQVARALKKVLRRQSSFRAQHHRREYWRMRDNLTKTADRIEGGDYDSSTRSSAHID